MPASVTVLSIALLPQSGGANVTVYTAPATAPMVNLAQLDYIANSTANGVDANGNAITGYKWWNFAYPTLATTGANAIANFISASNGIVAVSPIDVTAGSGLASLTTGLAAGAPCRRPHGVLRQRRSPRSNGKTS